MTLIRAPPGSATTVPKRLFLLSNEDTGAPVYVRSRLIRRATSRCKQADENSRFAQKSYRRYYDLQVRTAPSFEIGDEIYLHKLLLLRSFIEKSITDRYCRQLPGKLCSYKVVRVIYNTLRKLQEELKSSVSICPTTLAPNSERYSGIPNEKEEGSTKEEPRSQSDFNHSYQNAHDLYVIDKIVRHVRLSPWLKYVVG